MMYKQENLPNKSLLVKKRGNKNKKKINYGRMKDFA